MECLKCTGCIQSRCNSGFYGPFCAQQCPPNCRKLSCSACSCEDCNVTSGFCTNSCDFGFYGSKCHLACPENCKRAKEKGLVCDRTSGVCLKGCKRGFYGRTCNSTCSIGCEDSLCTAPNGTCVNRCIDGYYGELCTKRFPASWDHDAIAGAVGGGVIVILWATVIVVLICVIWRRRLKELAIFKINNPLGEESEMESGPFRWCDSEISANQVCLQYDTKITSAQHSGHRPVDDTIEMRFLNRCACSLTGSNRRYGTSDFHVHFINEETDKYPTRQTRRTSSEGDVREITSVWKPVKM